MSWLLAYIWPVSVRRPMYETRIGGSCVICITRPRPRRLAAASADHFPAPSIPMLGMDLVYRREDLRSLDQKNAVGS